FRREKAIVLLIGSMGAVPHVRGLAVAVANAVETVKNTAVVRRMDLGMVRQAIRDHSVALRRIEMVKYLIRSDPTGFRGLVERVIVLRQHRPRVEEKVGVIAGVIVPGEASPARRRVGRKGRVQLK